MLKGGFFRQGFAGKLKHLPQHLQSLQLAGAVRGGGLKICLRPLQVPFCRCQLLLCCKCQHEAKSLAVTAACSQVAREHTSTTG